MSYQQHLIPTPKIKLQFNPANIYKMLKAVNSDDNTYQHIMCTLSTRKSRKIIYYLLKNGIIEKKPNLLDMRKYIYTLTIEGIILYEELKNKFE